VSLGVAARERIERGHRFDAFLANHLPMAMVALDAMGASAATVNAFADRYERRLEPLRAARFEIAAGTESTHLGVTDAFPAWIGYFEHRLAGEGVPAVLREWMPTFARGIASGAFHCAIRTAYALEAGLDSEMAHALAYWAAAFQPLGEAPRAKGRREVLEVVLAVPKEVAGAGLRPAGRNILERTVAAASLPGFAECVGTADPARLTLDTIAAVLIRAYGASRDFTLLHGVTACHALRLLQPLIPDRDAAIACFWRDVLAAYVGSGCPPLGDHRIEPGANPDWDAILAGAILCEDEHDVKLAYTCWREWQRNGDEAYREAAARRVLAGKRVQA
jgi:hypothetical protein